jgi:hypothetical protein
VTCPRSAVRESLTDAPVCSMTLEEGEGDRTNDSGDVADRRRGSVRLPVEDARFVDAEPLGDVFLVHLQSQAPTADMVPNVLPCYRNHPASAVRVRQGRSFGKAAASSQEPAGTTAAFLADED